MSLFLFLTLIFVTNQINPSMAIRQSYTLSGKRCITDCLSYTYYYYCYYTFYQWDYCEPNKTGENIQYFTSLIKETEPNCTSQCDFFDYQYQWCFVGEKAAWKWDYCSALAEYSVYGNKCINKCVKGESGSYGCIVRDSSDPLKKFEACGPDPVMLDKNEEEFVVDMIMIENNDIGTDLRYVLE